MNDQYVTITIKTTVPVEDVPNILNSEDTELVSLEVSGQPMANGTRGFTGRQAPAPKFGTPKSFQAKTTKTTGKARGTKRLGLTAGLLELFTGAPQHNYTPQEIQGYITRIGAASSPSTAIHNVNQSHKNAIIKRPDNTWRLNPKYTPKKVAATA